MTLPTTPSVLVRPTASVRMRFSVLLGAILFSFTVSAQAPEAQVFTDGYLNGRGWPAFDKPAKIAWIVGYREGVNEVIFAHPDCKGISNEHRYLASSLTAEEVAKGIDNFYQELPAYAAIAYVSCKASGESPNFLEQFKAKKRKQIYEEKN